MNSWIKRFLIITQIAGGIFGLYIIGKIFLKQGPASSSIIINSVFGFLYLFGIIAGFALMKGNKPGIIMSMLFQLIQIPIFITRSIAYIFASGAFLNIYMEQFGGWGVKFALLNSNCYLHLDVTKPWFAGINALALALFIFLVAEFVQSIEGLKDRSSQRTVNVWTNNDLKNEIKSNTPAEPAKPSLTQALRS